MHQSASLPPLPPNCTLIKQSIHAEHIVSLVEKYAGRQELVIQNFTRPGAVTELSELGGTIESYSVSADNRVVNYIARKRNGTQQERTHTL